MRCDLCGESFGGDANLPTLASDTLPRDLRIWHIIGCKRRGIEPLINVSRSTWYQGIEDGRYPKGHKVTSRHTV